jgi:NADH-quinone oxidoreductase subunit C
MQAKMTKSDLAEKIKEKFGCGCIVNQDVQVTVPAKDWKSMAQFLKDLGLDYFSFLTAVDKGEKFVIIARVENLEGQISVILRCELPAGEKLTSIASLYAGADWMEREVYDMFGIEFEGHPNLKRILMPEDYQGFPLRKEFPLDQRYEPYR